MLNIGDKVNYIHSTSGIVVEGEGIVTAIYLDADKRVSVRVDDTAGTIHNVTSTSINPSEYYIESFKELVQSVDKLTEEGNKAIKTLTDEINLSIETQQSIVLGVPLGLETSTAEQITQAKANRVDK